MKLASHTQAKVDAWFEHLARTGQMPLFEEMDAAHQAGVISDRDWTEGLVKMLWPTPPAPAAALPQRHDLQRST